MIIVGKEGLEIVRVELRLTSKTGGSGLISFGRTGGDCNPKETGRYWAFYGVDASIVGLLAGTRFDGTVVAWTEMRSGMPPRERIFHSPDITLDEFASDDSLLLVDNGEKPEGYLADEW